MKIKPIDLHSGEEIIYTQDLTRISTYTRYYPIAGLFIVTNKRVIHSPTSLATKMPGKVWSEPLQNIRNVSNEQRISTKKDFGIGLLLDWPMRITRWFIKYICIELENGSKSYFTIEKSSGTVKNINARKREPVAAAAKELREVIVKARVASSLHSPTEETIEKEQMKPGAPAKSLREKIDHEKSNGWLIQSEGDTEAVVYKPSYGSLGGHLLIAILTIWWSYGLGNLAYLLYKYVIRPPTKVVRGDASYEPQANSSPKVQPTPPTNEVSTAPSVTPETKQADNSTSLSETATIERAQREVTTAGNGEIAEDRSNPFFDPKEGSEHVMESEKAELLTTITEEHPKSIKETARLANRPTREVSRDLNELESRGIIKFEKHGSGKRPVVQRSELSREKYHSDNRPTGFDPIERIERLQDLRQKGAISDAEFERAKGNLLGEM